MTMFLLGALCGIAVTGALCLALVRHEIRKPWWRS
jgi:hypothetical protein